MKFFAHKSNTFIGWVIRLFSMGRFSHISIFVNGFVYEARMSRGVIRTPYEKWDGSTVAETIDHSISKERADGVQDWLEEQVGKKYDWLGIVSFFFILLPPRRGYWYCSELAAVAFAKSRGYEGEVEGQKISPEMFWTIINLVL